MMEGGDYMDARRVRKNDRDEFRFFGPLLYERDVVDQPKWPMRDLTGFAAKGCKRPSIQKRNRGNKPNKELQSHRYG